MHRRLGPLPIAVQLRVVCLLAVLAMILTVGRATRAEDWAAFLGPRGDGTSAETGVDPDRWNPHPPIVWTMPLGISYGGPAIVGRRLLQFDRFGDEERITCYDKETRQELWRWQAPVVYSDMFNYNNGPRCSPVVDDGLVFIYGVSGRLSCLELESGKLLWSKDTLAEYSVVPNFFGVASTPYVYGDKLLVMVGGSPPDKPVPPGRLELAKPDGSAIVAVDKQTGKEVYRLGDELASYSALTVRQIEGRPTGLAFLRGGLIAWDPDSGEQLFDFPWRAPMLESVNAAVPVTLGNRILLSEAYEVGSVLLEVKDSQPKVVWQDSGPRNSCKFRAHWSTPIVVDGFLYGCNGRNQPDSDFRCVRLSDGEVQWQQRQHERSSVTLIDGYLIVLGEYGRLELIKPNPKKLEVVAKCDLSEIADQTDGRPLLESPCWAAPVVADGCLYVRGDRRLVNFQLISPQ
ncbi:MAG: PQQ-binding-like beta-propeller repeat protein [Pirellulaceae bacterium]